MSETRHSIMAEGVAISRAVHQLYDEEPLIFRDPLATRIIGAAGHQRLRDNLPMYSTEGLRCARTSVTVRARLAEEEVARLISRGPVQYVILGAGLDTYAYRNQEPRDRLTVYEIDQPDTQRWKLERLAEAGIEAPGNVRFVPVDFNERTLAGALTDAGFRCDVPAVFAWLGVVYYLPRSSVLDTLRYIAGMAAATAVVFDYAIDESQVGTADKPMYRQFMEFNRTNPEPWQTWFRKEEILGLLGEFGFTELLHLDAREIREQYLTRRGDGLLPSPLVSIVTARKE